MGIALLILKKYWLPILLVLTVLGILGYVKVIKVERDHYKSQAATYSNELNTLKKEAAAKTASLVADRDAIEKKYKSTLSDANALIISNAKTNEENIRNAKELHDVKLSLAAIRLFNASKQSDDSSPKADTGNVASTSSTPEAPPVTMQSMLLVVNENDKEHLKCIKQVKAWQNFYVDVQAAVAKANNAGQR